MKGPIKFASEKVRASFFWESKSVNLWILPMQIYCEVLLHPPEDHPGVATEPGEHEEVDEGVECRGRLGKQRDRHPVPAGDLLDRRKHFGLSGI